MVHVDDRGRLGRRCSSCVYGPASAFPARWMIASTEPTSERRISSEVRVVVERGLEDVVAKRLDSRYFPGEHGWVKQKNRETWWRYELEREDVLAGHT